MFVKIVYLLMEILNGLLEVYVVLIKTCLFYFFKRCILKYVIKDIYNFNIEN